MYRTESIALLSFPRLLPTMNKPVVICIDDEPIVLESLRRELEEALENKFDIETAVGGIEALDLVESLLAVGCQIAVVISDYIMPDLKGDEVLRRIHEVSPNTLKIMLTGQATLEGVTNAINSARLYRYIAKPWSSEELNLTVREALEIHLLEQQIATQKAQLQAKDRHLDRVLDAMPIGVCVHDATGQVTYANNKAKELLQIEAIPEAQIDCLSQAYRVYRANTDRLYPAQELPIVRSLAGQTVCLDDLEVHRGDRIIPVEVTATPLLDDAGQINGAIATFQDIAQRKKAQALLTDYNRTLEGQVTARTAQLRKSQEQFRQAFETAAIGKVFVSPEGQFWRANPAACQILGYSETELRDLTFHEITYPEDLETDIRHLRHLIAGKIPYYHTEKRYIHKNRQIVWALLSVSLVRDSENKPLYFVAQIQDITERKQWQVALQASEIRYATLTQMSPVGIFRTDAQGGCSFVNPRWCEMTGLNLEDAFGDGWARALHPDDRDRVTDEWNRAVRLNLPFSSEYRFLCASGTSVWVVGQAVPEPDADGNTVSYIGTITDISALKQAEANLQEKNETLKNTLQELQRAQDELVLSEKMAALGQLVAGVAHEINSPLGAIRSSVTYIRNFLEDNLQHFPAWFGKLSPQEEEYFVTLLARSQRRKTSPSSRELRQRRKALTQKLRDRNLADARTLATLLVDLGVDEDLEAFLPICHAPNGQALLNKVLSFVRLQTSTNNIDLASDRAEKIVFALKSYARHDRSQTKTRALITDGIQTILTLYHSRLKQGIETIFECEEIPEICCYPDELNQVWTNLIHNALQAMGNRGTLKIEVTQKNSQICVEVNDSGKGIPPEILPNIFQPFFTTKPIGEGSGLGLDIVRRIIDKHQGKIEVSSVPGKTKFTVLIPIVDA